MADRIFELKEGIKLHLIKNDIYKTNLICIIVTTPLNKINVTKNALLPLILKRGSKNFPSYENISLRLEELYGTSLNCGVDKVGDNQILKFVAESIDNNYTLNGYDLIKDVINLLIDIAFNPYLENGKFKENIVQNEKVHLQNLIESKINNKEEYAVIRCMENMYEFDGYGLYRFGYVDDLEKITLEDITNYYFELMKTAKIDIFVSGNINEEHVKDIVEKNPVINLLEARKPSYIPTSLFTDDDKKVDNPKIIQEKMDVNQGKLVMGYNALTDEKNYKGIGTIFNTILGDSANSLLFQNVREKSGLAYTIRSSYINIKKLFIIRAGIETQNYDKAVELIKEQIENVIQGKFSEKDIENAKTYIVSGVKNIEVEEDSELVYYMGLELTIHKITIDEYIKQLNSVTKEQIMNFAKSMCLNTIYFLSNSEE